MRVHLTKAGEWRLCRLPERLCRKSYHLPDMDVKGAQALPQSFLLPLLSAMTPPDQLTSDGQQVWLTSRHNGHPRTGFYIDSKGSTALPIILVAPHRDYDLPAIIRADGTKEWWHRGGRHREKGPAVLGPDKCEYWRNDQQVREDNLSDEQVDEIFLP